MRTWYNKDNKNQTVGAPGSNVPDYGRSRQEMEEKAKQENKKEEDIPMGNEETMGNP